MIASGTKSSRQRSKKRKRKRKRDREAPTDGRMTQEDGSQEAMRTRRTKKQVRKAQREKDEKREEKKGIASKPRAKAKNSEGQTRNSSG